MVKSKLATLLILLTMAGMVMNAQKEIKLYPNGVTESNGLEGKESFRDKEFIKDISVPRMHYFPAELNPNGTAVVICPGGGYGGVSMIKEGEEIAKWFNARGVAAFVLYYRMPNSHYEIPLKDALQSIQLVRSNAKAYGLNKKKIGIMGFSAGGHLASSAGTQYTSPKNRPDFLILAYPVISMKLGTSHGGSRKNLLGNKPDTLLVQRFSSEERVTRKTPPAFLFHATDDKTVPVENSITFDAALKRSKVPSELHVFEKGGHGFGMRPVDPKTDRWPEYLEQWMVKMKFMNTI
jgi:acetyl esterase/lipase